MLLYGIVGSPPIVSRRFRLARGLVLEREDRLDSLFGDRRVLPSDSPAPALSTPGCWCPGEMELAACHPSNLSSRVRISPISRWKWRYGRKCTPMPAGSACLQATQ